MVRVNAISISHFSHVFGCPGYFSFKISLHSLSQVDPGLVSNADQHPKNIASYQKDFFLYLFL